jgi:hypothetical protein
MSGRIRSIKPELLDDERTANLSDAAWRMFVSMIVLADDYGNLRGSAEYLGGQIWWARSSQADPLKALQELESADLVALYTIRGQTYAHLSGWDKHQRVDNAGKPRVPGPCLVDRNSSESLGGIPLARASAPLAAKTTIPIIGPPTTDRDHRAREAAHTDTHTREAEAEMEKPGPSIREHEYRKAYERGVTEGKGMPFSMPNGTYDSGALHQAILAHARHDGKRVTGPKLLEWIADHAHDFATWLAKHPDETKFYSAFGPKGFLRWLNERTKQRESREVG